MGQKACLQVLKEGLKGQAQQRPCCSHTVRTRNAARHQLACIFHNMHAMLQPRACTPALSQPRQCGC